MKKVIIKSGTLNEAAKDFVDAWHLAESDNKASAPVEIISFKDQRLLFKTLTPRRFDLLEAIHDEKEVSIRALAKKLGRDYSNVHQDVTVLFKLGLLKKDKETGKYAVPWDVIVTEISLPRAKAAKNQRHIASTSRRAVHE